MNKLFRITEIIWLVITIFCFIMSSFLLLNKQWNQETMMILGITFVAAFMYAMRRRYRLKLEKQQEEENNSGQS